MPKILKNKKYDLEERTLRFATECRDVVLNVPKNVPNYEYCKQFVRSSGSVMANYIEANESLSKKDFVHRVKICRKEAKESESWLKLVLLDNSVAMEKKRKSLIKEATEPRKIFGAIIEKSK